MSRYELKIELLSDMCVSDGGVYNSALDMEVCHDKYGFPYIPAKRLKGCLRESASELKDWGMEINIEALFGKKDHGTNHGDNRAALRLENAYVQGYQELKDYVMNHRNSPILHPQNILGTYTYIRTQTSIDYETGVADAGSLRTMRVVKKGLVFYAEVVLDEKYEEGFRKCCTNLNHMGIARTRGLGEVRLTLDNRKTGEVPLTYENKKSSEVSLTFENRNQSVINENQCTFVSKGDNCFEYALTLKEPMICKSINGGESNTLDYIEGSKILGLIAGKLKEQNKDFIEFVNQGELFCSNAYIEVAGERGSEVSGSIYSIKNEGDKYVDKTRHKEPKEKQLNAMKHCYVTKKDGYLTKKNVNTEEHYHHSRPEDKSIGRANDGLEGSKMYQMSAICAGQTFRGYITGTEEQIEEIAKMFHKGEVLFIGYSRSAEYGKTVLSECRCSKKQNHTLNGCKEIVVKLEAPAIIYNENATYSTNPMDLIYEINSWLGIQSDVVDVVNKYINYTTIGGYNVTWKKRKPTIEAFDKGTLLHYVFSEPMDITVLAEFYVGERITEGYGECSVGKVEKEEQENIGLIGCSSENQRKESVDYSLANNLVVTICDRLYRELISKKVNEETAKMTVSEADSSTISNMLIMCKENESFESIRGIVNKRYDKTSEVKQHKKQIAHEILDKVEADIITDKLCKEFEEHYNVCNYQVADKDFNKACALEEFLIALKYKVRTIKIGKGGDKNEQ